MDWDLGYDGGYSSSRSLDFKGSTRRKEIAMRISERDRSRTGRIARTSHPSDLAIARIELCTTLRSLTADPNEDEPLGHASVTPMQNADDHSVTGLEPECDPR